MGGFEDGERYRGQQTTLSFEDPDPQEVKIPVAPPQTKPSKPALPVRIHFMKGDYTNEHLHFFCQCYTPYGANPEYPDDRKYRGNSQMCDRCFKIVDGVPYKSPFRCSKDGGSHIVYHSLFNWNPLDHVDKYQRKMITAGLKWLGQDEGGKHVRRKTKEPK